MKKIFTVIGLAAATLAGLTSSKAQSLLNPGDLMFVQMASDTPDSFSWVFTKDIKAGTTIIFTDNAWDQTNFWRIDSSGRMTENSIVWTAATDIAAGVINQYSGSFLSLAASGDNIFAFQGSWQNAQFISGVTWDQTDTWITSGPATSNNSYLPSALTNGTTAFGRGATGDNTAYTGATTSGTTGALRTAVYGTPANWSVNDTTVLSPTAGPYTFTDATSATDATNTVAFYDFGLNGAGYSSAATKVNGTNGSQVSFGTFANAQVVSGGNLALDADGKDGFNNQGYSTENTSTAFGTNSGLDLAGDAAFQFTLTINPGYQFDFEYGEFWAMRNTNGPQTLGLFYSLDSGSSWSQIGSNLSLTGVTWQSFSFTDSLNSLSGWTGNVDFRIYAWNAAGDASQQLRLDEIYIAGIVVPEPSTALLLGLGAGVLFLRRKFFGVNRA